MQREKEGENLSRYDDSHQGRWTTCKLIIGIISIALFILIVFQSCAAGLGNAMSGSDEASGTFGIMVAFLMLIAGIVGVITRDSDKKGGAITCFVFYWICFFFSRIGSGSFSDLRIWGILAYAFGCVHLFSVMQTKKSTVISIIVAAIYFTLGML